ncbi:glycogen synthase GlgA [Ectopseudomonas hydrolytica]|uniref:glycogen synthase GlgA n=1 Tax=Ectopseudomonas hydrolytica TaxID=2493633 RepID=UPI003C2C426C
MGTAAAINPNAKLPADIQPPLHMGSHHPQRKRVLFVTSEFSDLIKCGGLGDVSAALPRALAPQHDIRLLIPGYRQVVESGWPIRIVGHVRGLAALPPCRIGRMDLADGLIVYVLLNPVLYERDGTPYGDAQSQDWPDNHIRFARLGLAAAEIATGDAGIQWRPDLVHANDWPASMAPAYMAWRGATAPALLTIHNLAYQGLCDMACSSELAIPEEACGIDGMEFHGRLSFLKAGISYAHHVTTVSRTYAQEITTPAFGCGLEGMLQAKVAAGQLSGIVNGIDESWNPETDPHLLQGFAPRQWEGKRANAAYVEQWLGLEAEGPLFAVISRLVQQKGIDLTLEVAEHIVAQGGRIGAIGRGEPALEAAMTQLAQRYPGRIGVHIGFNETDARRLYAASDFLLMPSRFEPCGLSQIYAQRFASLPIARRTGGLADTIEDGVSGFLFDEPDAASYRAAIDRALRVYRHRELFDAMRCHAMHAPLYWRQSVRPYDRLYQRLLARSSARREQR